MKERYVIGEACSEEKDEDMVMVKPVEWKELRKRTLEFKTWSSAAIVLKELIDSGYHAVVSGDECCYTITYDWRDPDWCDCEIMWIKSE
jgi:hypothetical protein